jgi:nucleotide-binding universal stress UspA family protein
VKERGIELVVMGTRGRSPLELLVFGSVAQRVVRRSPCPVLTVSAPPKKA